MTLYWYIAHRKHTVLLVSVSTGLIGGAGLGLALHGPAPARCGLGSRAPYMDRPARPERVAVRLTGEALRVETHRSTQRHPNMDEDREEFHSNALTFLNGCPKSCKTRDGYISSRVSLCDLPGAIGSSVWLEDSEHEQTQVSARWHQTAHTHTVTDTIEQRIYCFTSGTFKMWMEGLDAYLGFTTVLLRSIFRWRGVKTFLLHWYHGNFALTVYLKGKLNFS